MTPTITFRQARAAEACPASYKRMRETLGTGWGMDDPVPLTTVLDVLGMADTLWALDVIGEHRTLRLFAADCAERVVHLTGPDPRCVQAMRVARLHAHGLASDRELTAARNAARNAGEDAAWDAARAAGEAAGAAGEDAAWAAAEAADRAAAGAAARATVGLAGAAPSARNARSAAWEAERAWQADRLRAYLTGVAP